MAPKAHKLDESGKPIRYYDVLDLGRDPDGKRIRHYVYGKTKAQVKRKMAQLQNDHAQGIDLRADKQTVEQFLRTWITKKPLTRKGRVMADRTWQSYVQIVRDFLIPHLGSHKLINLTAGHIEDMSTTLLEQGCKSSYVQKMISVLSKALSRAERDRVIVRNVAKQAIKLDTTPPAKKRPTDAQIRQLLAMAQGDRDEVIVHVLVKTGVRRGEALGIRWSDLDLEQGTLEVTGMVERPNVQNPAPDAPKTILHRKSSLKTDSSVRVIALAPSLIPLLHRRKAEQELERVAAEKLGHTWANPNDLVFTNPTGGPIDPRTFSDRYKALCRRAGLPAHVTIHDMRHANITKMITSNQVDPKTAQEMAGHSDVRITLGFYTHSNLDLQRAAAALIDSHFSESSDDV